MPKIMLAQSIKAYVVMFLLISWLSTNDRWSDFNNSNCHTNEGQWRALQPFYSINYMVKRKPSQTHVRAFIVIGLFLKLLLLD